MKLNLKIAALLAAAMFVGCSQFEEEATIVGGIDGMGRISQFSAQQPADDASRAGIEELKSIWHGDDDLTVVRFDAGATDPVIVNCAATAESLTADKKGITFGCTSNSNADTQNTFVYESGEQYALYPQIANPTPSKFKAGEAGARLFSVSLAEQQSALDGSFRYPLLIGKWDDVNQMFCFVNPFSTLRFTVKAPAGKTLTLRKIQVVGRNGEMMWGDATISANSDFATIDAVAVVNKNQNVKAILDCQAMTVTDEGRDVYICVPAQEYAKGLSISFICDEGSMTKDLKTSGITTKQNQLVTVPALPLDELDDSGIHTALLRATDTTLSFGWTTLEANAPYLYNIIPKGSTHNFATEKANTFLLELFKDEACTDLQVSWQIADNTTVLDGGSSVAMFSDVNNPLRFIFSGLTPSTNYYFRVSSTGDDGVKRTMKYPRAVKTLAKAYTGTVTTSKATAGKTILFENFANMLLGGDMTTRAAGYSVCDKANVTSLAAATATGATPNVTNSSAYYVAPYDTEHNLFETTLPLIPAMGLGKWAWDGDASMAVLGMRPGYVKIGGSSKHGMLLTPQLSALTEASTIRVRFKASVVGGMTVDDAERPVAVKVVDNVTVNSTTLQATAYDVISTAEFNIVGDQTAWNEYEVVLSGATPTSRVLIMGNREGVDVQSRIEVDDIQVIVERVDGVAVAQVRATDSNITIGWTVTAQNIPYIGTLLIDKSASHTSKMSFATDIAHSYKVAIYNDKDCTDLVHSLAKIPGSTFTDANSTCWFPRYTFSGLAPETTYYVVVTDETTGSSSYPLEVRTVASAADASEVVTAAGSATAGSLILFQNFAKLNFYNDQATAAAGYWLSGHTSSTTQPPLSGAATVGSNNQGRMVNVRMAKDGVGLFNNHMPSIDYLGLKNWGWYGDGADATGSSVGFMTGYAKIGSGSNSTTIYTPALAALPAGKECIIRVTFKAAPYGTPSTPISTDDKKVVKISAVKAPKFDAATTNTSTSAKVTGGTVVSSDTITLEGDYTNWQEYSVTLPFVTSDCRIGIGGNNSKTTERFFLDDIRIEVVSVSDGLWCDLVRATDTTLSIGWSITKANVTSGFYTKLFPNTPASCKLDHNGYTTNGYTIYLYKDEACTDVELQLDLSGDFFAYGTKTTTDGVVSYPSNFPARYIFGGLTPNTQYWFKVKDKLRNVTAGPLAVKTLPMIHEGGVSSDAEVGDVVLFQNFGRFLYGGDVTNYSAGYTEGNRASTTKMHKAEGKVSWSAQTIDGEAVDFGRVSAQSYYNIFKDMSNLVDDMGMTGWSYYSGDDAPCAFMRPGYMRVGGNSAKGAICSPELSSIHGVADVKVTFKAAYFTTVNYNISVNENMISVRNQKGGTVTDYRLDNSVVVDEQTVTIDQTKLGEWQEFTVTLKGVENDCRIAFAGAGNGTTDGSCRFMLDDIKVEITGITKTISGKISAPASAGGKGVAGITVTDGYSTTVTDANGRYTLPYNEKARFVQYTTPANYEIGRDGSGYPIFYKKFDKSTTTYNFTLGTKFYNNGTLADGVSNYNTTADKHNKWFLYVMADPQTHDSSVDKCMDRFTQKVCADLKYVVKQRGYNSAVNASDGTKQAIGIVLGDIGWDSVDGEDHHADMKAAMGVGRTGVYWFTVPGNHDYNFNSGKTARTIDEFEAAYGPSNLSFERGDVHIVGINSCQFSGTSYTGEISEYEYNWLVRDLSVVDRSKCVVLCLHIPAFSDGLGVYKDRILDLLAEFDKAYIFSGHRHANKTYLHKSVGKEILEVNHAAACGQFWNVSMCNDGSPAGYTIYTFTGNDITVQRFKAIGTNDVGNVNSTLAGNNYIENGLRVYWAADQISNTTEGSNENYVNLYTFGTGQKNAIVANVFMGHNEGGSSGIAQSWKVEFSEDSGATWKSMTLMKSNNRHSAPKGMYATTQAYGTDAWNYKVYVVDSNGYNLNSSNYSGTAVTHSSTGNANTGSGLYIRNDLDWWMWGMTMDRGNNTITNREGNETGNCWSYSNVSPHMYWGTMSKSYTSVSAVQADVKSGKLQIRAYLPGNYSHTYTADKITEFKKYTNTGREGLDWYTATVPTL